MVYTLNEYCQFGDCKSARVVVYPNIDTAAYLLAHHKNEVKLSVSDCISDGAVLLPMPDTLFACLDNSIATQNGRVVITGIDAYLSLLSKQNIDAFFVALRHRIDEGNLNATYLLSSSYNIDRYFVNPKYEQSLDVVKIATVEMINSVEPPKVEVVSSKWFGSANNLNDYKTLLKRLGDSVSTGKHLLVLNDLRYKQAGLSENISFYVDVQQVAERFYSFNVVLKPSTMETLLLKAKEKNVSPEAWLEVQFGKENIGVRYALNRLIEMLDDELWMAYVWLLQKKLPMDTYLSKVLDAEPTHENLLRKYVVETAVTLLGDDDARRLAVERADALSPLMNTVEPLIVEFIGQTKNNVTAAEFLNCGTKAEMREIVRRAAKYDLILGLPDILKRICPVLSDYLSDYDYGDKDLTAYFKEYRRFKVNDTVTDVFAKKAFNLVLPTSLTARDSVLLKLSTDDDMALLVVDGMGAEYYPLLLAMAKRRNMNIESHAVVSVKLPTSTKYNPLKWANDRTLDEVKDIDNIAHYGEAKHEHCPPERNIAASLRVFESEVFPRISTGLEKYSRVVLTSDHGSSRLAVLARNNGLGATLPWNGNPLDWRYSVAPQHGNRPPEFESQYSASDGKTYWVVRGYNRLPKQGGKLNELHGGASLEERLVPIIVFSRVKTTEKPSQLGKKTMEQILDRMGFDI
ncbi:hypothetical protein Desdi_0766 [Desulfitobacterium dichloroeliminans LMG P-21439]|uniref:PglZ domain-containing protein n=1 Tax=Desulfitobacterium dichloroeliminans (strain LMG P-21439 / DCA1) TaxID=871963 RepID=L0F521_DESDL|nr:BREX-4 system phosphatase PglZ [Desulfitobacterium dichloroeliminans]AGA68292.1 hypothetical protein Desdi_0766 [Desulfitobacterium dichloroeliminans LMG P-21439]